MEISREGLLVIKKDGVPAAVVRMDEKCRHQVVYILCEAGAEDLERLLQKHE